MKLKEEQSEKSFRSATGPDANQNTKGLTGMTFILTISKYLQLDCIYYKRNLRWYK